MVQIIDRAGRARCCRLVSISGIIAVGSMREKTARQGTGLQLILNRKAIECSEGENNLLDPLERLVRAYV
jgi:hypothetical protein